jgi:hypothetical protein
VTLTNVPVIAPAFSEARNAAVAATSVSRGERRLLVEGVEHGHFGGTPIGFDVVGDRFEILGGATDDEDARSLTGELPNNHQHGTQGPHGVWRAANGRSSACQLPYPVIPFVSRRKHACRTYTFPSRRPCASWTRNLLSTGRHGDGRDDGFSEIFLRRAERTCACSEL